jgi:hypothetical protein
VGAGSILAGGFFGCCFLHMEDVMALSTKHKDPTPEEIRQRCLEIQAGWNDYDRAYRAGKRHDDAYTIPTARIRGERPEERKKLN